MTLMRPLITNSINGQKKHDLHQTHKACCYTYSVGPIKLPMHASVKLVSLKRQSGPKEPPADTFVILKCRYLVT